MQNDRQPLYIQVQDHFKSLIASGDLAENDKIPSERELMEQFSVSRITVANALAEMAKEGWIYRIPGRGSFVNHGVQDLVEQLKPLNAKQEDHQPSQSANRSRRKMIGLIIPSIGDYFAIRMVEGINQIVGESDYYLVILFTYNSAHREKEAIVELIQKGAEGLIIFPSDAENYNEEILTLKLNAYPFVLVDRYFPGVETNYVCSNGFLGTQLAVDHLWELGHRDIAICSDSPLPTFTVEDRIAGYMDALKKKEALINPALMLTEIDIVDDDTEEEHMLLSQMKNRLATAFIALNGRLGLHIASMAKSLNLRVPEDISIITFDDPSPSFEPFHYFTHVAQSEETMGAQAAQILLNQIQAPAQSPASYSKVVLQPQLVIRHTTARFV
ncbi:substrate-binding domain-containing protein [Paenibacillus sp. SYP-B3998]|uniref:Substrate-binding domain-containing protein n=1 Tax=Paenibacillus sp. SYP-B3998 TaxID=2678564 RepID=A0A6G3ZT88_9BACL|nr:substrate-binding domain-containing protein [Paenibacillus sp. SYP-B3998]NEW04801.1 substrate-binding domain-containing protein [Paenibacillus sp. SYP-B3998]